MGNFIRDTKTSRGPKRNDRKTLCQRNVWEFFCYCFCLKYFLLRQISPKLVCKFFWLLQGLTEDKGSIHMLFICKILEERYSHDILKFCLLHIFLHGLFPQIMDDFCYIHFWRTMDSFSLNVQWRYFLIYCCLINWYQ